MLDVEQRAAILALTAKGRGVRTVARLVGASRNAVRRVLAEGKAVPDPVEREVQARPHLERIATLFTTCQGNLVRVREVLADEGIEIAYSTLTRFCREHGIGVVAKVPVGRYDFEPGEEMQHDTSPHRVVIAGQERLLQCASLVLCHSRMIFAQAYPRWTRFWCKVFLTEALRAFGGAARRCMLDNSHVILASGSGKNAVMSPEMAAFARRFGFRFEAHAVGHAERSGRVERPFDYIENNFYPGRTFADVGDLNAQFRAWCDQKNGTVKRHLRAAPVTLFAHERTVLAPLPEWVPTVEEIHTRVVDSEGYVTLHTNRYSVPVALIAREVDVHESATTVRVFDPSRRVAERSEPVAEHPRLEDGLQGRATRPEHQDGRRWRHGQHQPPMLEQERVLRAASTVIATWLDALRARGQHNARVVRAMHQLWMDFPAEPLERAVARATEHGLMDTARIESIVLRELAGTYFRLDPAALNPDGGDDDE